MPWTTLTIAVTLPALLAQYTLLYFASTSAHARMPACLPGAFGGYSEAYRGWDNGVCFTEEQLWCRAHPGKHPVCLTADCRAEEVRLSLPGRSSYNVTSLREPVWSGCSAAQLLTIFDRFITESAWQGACVPLGDKRSTLLRFCEVRASHGQRRATCLAPVFERSVCITAPHPFSGGRGYHGSGLLSACLVPAVCCIAQPATEMHGGERQQRMGV